MLHRRTWSSREITFGQAYAKALLEIDDPRADRVTGPWGLDSEGQPADLPCRSDP